MSIKPERDCKYSDWIFIQHYHIREYLVGFWWGSANSKRNHRGRRSTKVKRTDHQMLFDTGNKRNHITGQLADNLQMPIKKNPHHWTASRKPSVTKQCIRDPDRQHVQRIKTQTTADSCYRTHAVNERWIVSTIESQCCTKEMTGTLQRACIDTKKIEHLIKGIIFAD